MTSVIRAQQNGIKTGAADNNSSVSARSECKKPISVVNPTGKTQGENSDVVVITGDAKNTVTEKIQAKLTENENKFKELGFNHGFKSKLLPRIGYTETLEPEKQLSILEALSSVLDHFISEKNNNRIEAEGYNILHAITITTTNFISQKEQGNVDTLEEFLELSSTDNKEFKKAKTGKEKISAIENKKKRIIGSINKKRQIELKKCKTSEEKEKVNQKYDNFVSAVLEQVQLDQIRLNSKEDAKYSVYVREGNKQAEAHRLTLLAFLEEFREEIADSFTHDFEVELLKTYYENGDPVSAEEYGNIVDVLTEYQSTEAIEQYKADAEKFAQNNEETPWYTKEHAEAETKVFKNREIQEVSKNNSKAEINEEAAVYAHKVQESEPNIITYKNKDIKAEKENTTEKDNKSKISNESSAKDIAAKIKNGEITVLEAIYWAKEKGYDAIFEDPDLFAKNRTIARLHVNNFRKDLDKLLELSNFSSAIELIVQNISPTIKNEYAHEVKLSGITKDAIFGKNSEENAAA